MSQAIAFEEMRESLLTVDEVRTKLQVTENLGEYDFDTGAKEVQFSYPAGWQGGLDKEDNLALTSASIKLANGVERRLTLGAAVEAASIFGLQKSYTLACPGPMIEDHLNHWYNNSDKRLKLLASEQAGVGLTRATVKPFSNIELLDAALTGIEKRYGNADEVLVDYKFLHTIDQTNMRLIVPASRTIASARNSSELPDSWSLGLDISNSVTGATALQQQGYLFSWWCTNGATTTHVASGKYRRKPSLDVTDAYEWAAGVVDEILGGLEHELDKVAELTQIPLEGELNETLGQIFRQFNVPVNVRGIVLENLVESDDLTAYGLMNAITAAANDSTLSANAVAALLAAGGRVPGALASRCETCHNFNN